MQTLGTGNDQHLNSLVDMYLLNELIGHQNIYKNNRISVNAMNFKIPAF